MVFQEYNLVERLSVMENVLSGRLGYVSAWTAWRRKFDDADIQKAFGLLKRVGLADFANRRADELSGGGASVGIARAVMQAPGLLLADEPTSSLDPKTSVEIMELMRDLAAENNVPVMINIHQVELGKRYAERVIGMSGGLVVYDGAPGWTGWRRAAQDLRRRRLAGNMSAIATDRAVTHADFFTPSLGKRLAWVAWCLPIWSMPQRRLGLSLERVQQGLDMVCAFLAGIFRPTSPRPTSFPVCLSRCRLLSCRR